MADYNPQTGSMTVRQRCFPKLRAGSFHLDERRGILYCVNERTEVPGETLGGQVCALKIDPASGALEALSVSPSYGPLPSDCAIDRAGRYLIVSNHSGRGSITRTVQDAGGDYHIVREYDETAVVLFPLDGEGRIGAPLDIARHIGCGALPSQQNPHAHCVRRAPDSDLFIVCDKGSDSIYAYRIDTELDKLVCCDRIDGVPGSFPRYCVFHPTQPYLYYNHETMPLVGMARYDRYGKLTPTVPVRCMDGEGQGMQSDLRIGGDGRFLYTLVRENSTIVSYRLEEETGMPTPLQTIPCGSSRGGRWLAFSPDGRYLFLAACPDAQVYRFAVGGDGTLTPDGVAAEDQAPAALVFWTVDARL